MSYRVDFDGFYPFASNNRPYASISCYGVKPSLSPRPARLSALIDTGADYLVLPNWVGLCVGLNLHHYPSKPVLTAGSSAHATMVDDFTIELEGQSIEVSVQFVNIAGALLGLPALLSAIDVGFDNNLRWFFKK